ncbi:hypothetical protein ACI2LJ_35945 [Streptomyces sp. NPDC088090]|uniref:hypothetical protein n=1 Tax=Streptomyces sp. NPDC088090 TaxID=3365822 RepID=UPI00384FDE50
MDPTVIAAIITSPTVVIAAAAAYAAGRRQARGAHRGPVDAVRRQHQRDAYAALLVAANDFTRDTSLAQCHIQARQEVPDTGQPDYRDQVTTRAKEIRRDAAALAYEALSVPFAAVFLEGPEQVSQRAKEVKQAAHAVNAAAYFALLPRSIEGGGVDTSREARITLAEAVDVFTVAARDHLNSAGG